MSSTSLAVKTNPFVVCKPDHGWWVTQKLNNCHYFRFKKTTLEKLQMGREWFETRVSTDTVNNQKLV